MMQLRIFNIGTALFLTLSTPVALLAQESETPQLKDMSDPLAVYSRAAAGLSNRGVNLKFGIEKKGGDSDKALMNVLEIKGIGGDAIGWDGDYIRSNSVDSLRYRYFSLNKKNGRGSQIDATYDLHQESGTVSYSLLQGLPKWKNFNLYPLAGAGLAYANNALQDDGSTQSGLSVPGALAVVGMYGKYTVNETIWLNYNPFWSVGLVGSDNFMNHGFEGHSSVLTHEVAVSYKLSSRSNVRYFANWSQHTKFEDGGHRIEYNYQF
ncbi:MAG: hypothetical protein V7754_20350 [Halioglobus sp.]